MFTIWCMIQRADRPFLSIWRGSREFTELRRGTRVLWQKEVPEEPKVPLARLQVTAASYADLALLDFVRYALVELGCAGNIAVTLAGEAHTLAGTAPLLTVKSEVVVNDGRTAELAIGSGSELHEGSLQAGDAVAVRLVLEPGEMWLPKVIEDGVHVADPLPCLLPDGRWAQLVGIAYRVESRISKINVIKRTIKLSLNGVPVGTAACAIDNSCKFERVWSFSLPETELNTVLAETAERPLTLQASNMATYFSKEGSGIKLVWGRIETVINLIVKDANENVL